MKDAEELGPVSKTITMMVAIAFLLVVAACVASLLLAITARLQSWIRPDDAFRLPPYNALLTRPAPTFSGKLEEGYIVPEELRGNNSTVIHFVSPEDVGAYCENRFAGACFHHNTNAIVMPNPCEYVEDWSVNSYTEALCHELAHANGWRHDDYRKIDIPTTGDPQ